MNVFQIAGVSLAMLMAIITATGIVRRRDQMRFRVLLTIIWLAAAGAILRPELSMRLANAVGIGRGADLVLYIVTLASIAAFFYIYLRFVTVENQLTLLVRHLALREVLPASDETEQPDAPASHDA